MIRKVEMERFSVTSSKPFDAVVRAIKAGIGHPNMTELWQATERATITTPWNNGPIEGHINRLKAIKRQMYGRAGVLAAVGFYGVLAYNVE